MTRTEQEIRADLADAELLLAKVTERQQRLQGHVDSLRRELQDTVGAASSRFVGAR